MIDDEFSAEDQLRRAVSARPDDTGLRARLAGLVSKRNRDEALAILKDGLIYAEGRTDRMQCLAGAFTMLDAIPDAITLLQAILRLEPDDGDACACLAQLWAGLGEKAKAEGMAARALRLGVEADLGEVPDGPTNTLTRHLFDQYAERFDHHLQDTLDYAAPRHVREALDRFGMHSVERAIDLGCGTGLMGPDLRARATYLAGIDLSPGMLEKARLKNCYDELVEGEIGRYLDCCEKADIIVAADVLVYVAHIGTIFCGVRRSLTRSGIFVATAERHPGDGFGLTESRRYAHSETYLRDMAQGAGLEFAECLPVVLRVDRGTPVDGLVFTLRLA